MNGPRKPGRTRGGPPRQPAVIDGEATRIEDAAPETVAPAPEPAPQVSAEGDPAPEPAAEPVVEAAAAAEPPASQPGPASEEPRTTASGADWGAPAGTGFEGAAAAMPPSSGADADEPRARAAASPVPMLIAATLAGLAAGALGGYAGSAWTRPDAPDTTREIAALQTQVKALASLRAEIAGGAKQAETAARQAGESAARPLADALAQARAALDAIATRMEALEGRVAEVAATAAKPQLPEEVTALTRQMQALQTSAGERAKALETAAQDGARALERIAGLEKNLAQSGAVAGATARLALVQRIRADLAEGRPFRSEVEALAGLGVAQADLDALRAAADRPVTAVSLAETLERTIRRINAEPSAPEAQQDVSDRVLGWLGGVVRVRRVDATSGRAAPLVAVREALGQGDVAQAAQRFEATPQDLRAAAGEDFATGLARLAAATAVLNRLGSEAFTVLGRTAGTGAKP